MNYENSQLIEDGNFKIYWDKNITYWKLLMKEKDFNKDEEFMYWDTLMRTKVFDKLMTKSNPEQHWKVPNVLTNMLRKRFFPKPRRM